MGTTENTFYSLARADGIELQHDAAASWLTNVGHLNATLSPSVARQLRELHLKLGGDPTLLASKRGGGGPRLDFLIAERHLVVEVDEIQHFTTDRLTTLRSYGDSPNLAYDVENYCSLISRWHGRADRYRAAKPAADFPFPGGRRAQRAYFDTCRDLAASEGGLRVLRVPAPECDGALAYRRFTDALDQLPSVAAGRAPLITRVVPSYSSIMPYAGWPDEVTPKDIARVLGISDKTLRQWLRDNRAAGHGRYERWVFTPREADEIVTGYRAARM
jgi:hypothetical protein